MLDWVPPAVGSSARTPRRLGAPLPSSASSSAFTYAARSTKGCIAFPALAPQRTIFSSSDGSSVAGEVGVAMRKRCVGRVDAAGRGGQLAEGGGGKRRGHAAGHS